MNTQITSLGEKGAQDVEYEGMWDIVRHSSGYSVPSSPPPANVIITPKKAVTLPSMSGLFLCRPPSVSVYPLLKLLSQRLPVLIQLNSVLSFHSLIHEYL